MREKECPSKKKQFTFNTMVISSTEGLMLGAGRTFGGGTHGPTTIAKDPMDLGDGHVARTGRTHQRGEDDHTYSKGYQRMDRYYPETNGVVAKFTIQANI